MDRTEILVQRNNSLYRIDFNSLSSIVLFVSEKEEFFKYLDELSATLETLNNTLDMALYSKEDVKSNLITVEALSNLSSDGNLVTKIIASNKANTLFSKEEIYKANNECWYKKQWINCAEKINTGFENSRNMIKYKANLQGDWPKVENPEKTYEENDF